MIVMKQKFLISCFVAYFVVMAFASAHAKPVDFLVDVPNVYVGMSQEHFEEFYPTEISRTYRKDGDEEWITYDYTYDFAPGLEFFERYRHRAYDMVTFYFVDELLLGWALNDRAEIVREYLSEYCSQAFIHYIPKMYEAISNCMNKIPIEVFYEITDRSRPVLFTEVHYKGMARFAATSNVISFEHDPPSFEKGFTLIKLSTELGDIGTVPAIEGVIYHELAHRFLVHGGEHYIREHERDANRLVEAWGFKEELDAAKEIFGATPHAVTDADEAPSLEPSEQENLEDPQD